MISSKLGYRKPDSRVFQNALAPHLGLGREEVVYVGDSWERDMIGARDAGIRGIWVCRSQEREGVRTFNGPGDLGSSRAAALDLGTFMTVCVKMGPGMMDCAGLMISLVLWDHVLAGGELAAGDGKRSGHGPRW